MLFPKPKKIKRTTLKHKADRLFSEKIREIGVCQLRGLDNVKCTDSLQCMHIIGRANYRLRWDKNNALSGCSGHHIFYTNHPWEWQELIRLHFPYYYAYINSVRNEIWDGDYDKIFQSI